MHPFDGLSNEPADVPTALPGARASGRPHPTQCSGRPDARDPHLPASDSFTRLSDPPSDSRAGGTLASGWRDVQNLLVMRLDNMGDVVMTGPALRAIKENLPGVHLTFMASEAGAQVTRLLSWIDDVFVQRVLWQELAALPFEPSRERALIAELRERKFDAAIIFTSFSQTPYPPALACLLAGIPLRLGESKERAEGILTHTSVLLPDEMHQAERNCRLIESIGFAVKDRHLRLCTDEYSRHAVEKLLAARGMKEGAPYILLNPWASAQARTFEVGRFGHAALRLAEAAGKHVVVTGTAQHKPLSNGLMHTLGTWGIDLMGATSARELAVLTKDAAMVLTNNTLTLHLADAFRTPAVILYAGTDLESQWRPRAAPHRLLNRPTACTPCYGFICPTSQECLDIPTDEIVAAGLELLNG